MLRSLLHGFQDLVYPPLCIQCRSSPLDDRPFAGLCPDCIRRIPLNNPPFCVTCGRHQDETYPPPRCRHCREQPPAFDFAWGACRFTPYVRGLLHQFKFRQRTYLRHAFVARMLDYAAHYNLDIDQFDAVVPMPLAPARQRERGYNQALLLAEPLARRFGKPLWRKVIVKSRMTAPQSSLGRKERFTNVRGAFRINPSERISGANILIIDDLLTTGATAAAAAHAAKSAGAGTVAVLTLAIA